MLNETEKSFIAKFLIAIIGSILLTFALVIAIKNDYKFVLWIYLGVTAVSTLVDRWFYGQQKNNSFLTINEHIFHSCVITLLLFLVVMKLSN